MMRPDPVEDAPTPPGIRDPAAGAGMPPAPGPTGNSESTTPTETQLLVDRDLLTQQRAALDRIASRRVRPGPAGAKPSDTVMLSHLLAETSQALGRAEALLEMAAVAIRAHTEQLLVANKIELRKLRLERERNELEERGERRVDLVLSKGLDVLTRIVTDGRVWTAIGTAATILAGQFAAGQGCHLPPGAP